MFTLETTEDRASALAAQTRSAGVATSVVREERFFGDAQLVSVVIEHTEHALTLVSTLVSTWSGVVAIRTAKKSQKLDLDALDESQLREKLKQLLE